MWNNRHGICFQIAIIAYNDFKQLLYWLIIYSINTNRQELQTKKLGHMHDFFKSISSCLRRNNYAMDYLIGNHLVYIGNNYLRVTHVQTLDVITTRAISCCKHFARVGCSRKSMVSSTLMVMHEYRALRHNLLVCKTALQREITFTRARDDRLIDHSLIRFSGCARVLFRNI